jgi:hypothetical protein
VWPLNPKGEIFVILMMEDTRGIEALPDILKKVKGIGAILIGEGDLSQELGYPRQYEHPLVLELDGSGGQDLQGAQCSGRPPACRAEQLRADHRRGLSLPNGGAGAQLRRLG